MSDLYANPKVLYHQTGPAQDHRARVTVVRTMVGQNHGIKAMAEVLDMLALLPGQESKRNIATADLKAIPKEQECGPRKKTQGSGRS